MKKVNQKCRYCANCIVGDVVYCDLKHKTMSDSTSKATLVLISQMALEV